MNLRSSTRVPVQKNADNSLYFETICEKDAHHWHLRSLQKAPVLSRRRVHHPISRRYESQGASFFDNALFQIRVQVLNPYFDEGKHESVTIIKKWIRKIFEWTEKGWIDKVAIIIGTGVNFAQLKYQFK